VRTLPSALRTALAALLFVPGLLAAAGKPEATRGPEAAAGEVATQATVQAYWILEPGAANARMVLERFFLPTSLSVLRWTEFRVGAGAIELASAGGYRVLRKEAILTERWPAGDLHGYTVRVSFAAEAEAPSGSSRTHTVSFVYDTTGAVGAPGGEAGVTPQPLQQALLKGIEADGRTSGLARVLDLEYRGNGRFRGKVEVR